MGLFLMLSPNIPPFTRILLDVIRGVHVAIFEYSYTIKTSDDLMVWVAIKIHGLIAHFALVVLANGAHGIEAV